jgi:cell division protein FtsI (penicillin-binding protein 3)
MIVMVDEPHGAHHGGDVAAPVFKRVAEQVLRYMSLPPDVPSYAPQYVIKQPKVERERRPERPQKPATTGLTQLVGMRVGENFNARSEDTDLGDIAIPDFHGKSLRQVTEESLKAGLRLQSVGSGAAVEQMPEAGATVRPGSRVQVRFSSRVER